jgi:probable phosphoglycerate mutase
VRHGETEWNLEQRQQGHLDSALTARGSAQARALAEGLADRGITAVYSSDLGRAVTTATVIGARLDLAVQTDERLRERHLGSLQGLTKAQWRQQFPDEWAAFAAGDPDYRFPGGESVRDRYQRTVDCLSALAAAHPGATLLVVAHGGVLDGLFHRVTGLALSAPRQFALLNAAINRVSVSGDAWRLETWGETAHLRGLPALDDA